ncbi:UNVERIFIED_CONTAM: hypothetical protein Sradi_3174000 [Sesamum radiatum]|uniref:Uncharacterized protein n=1 Tax=Sesamum radiatum TaxID=300843 RepID=A0AAW2RFI2_SESRA
MHLLIAFELPPGIALASGSRPHLQVLVILSHVFLFFFFELWLLFRVDCNLPSPARRNEATDPSLVVVDPDDVSLQVKYQSMISKEPWSAIISNVKVPIAKIKERYYIPHDYKVLIPRQFDRMHRPPEGFCPFSL